MINLDTLSGSLINPIQHMALTSPDKLALIFIHEDGREESISISMFYMNARRFSARLRRQGIRPGDVIILVLEHSPDLLYGFMGAINLGAVPSIFPLLNEKLNPQYYVKQVSNLVANSGAKAVVTGEKFGYLFDGLESREGFQVIRFEQINELVDPETPLEPEAELDQLDQIAFLQHSSGTTGLQKGVALSHGAVLNQLKSYSRAIELDSEDVIVSWLPLYHDMGLIAGFVMPIVLGIPLIIMSPFYWVRDPKKLLEAIEEYRGTLCWLPNFAYNHMHRAIRPRDIEGLDLSSIRMIVNCSEPIRLDSHQRLYSLLSDNGLKKTALATCYAMAENTFAVTQSKPGEYPHIDWVHRSSLLEGHAAPTAPENLPTSSAMVSCGYPLEQNKIKIVGPAGDILLERQIGEIIIQSNSMLSEYHRQPELTSRAVINGWLYTGDIGYLAEGHLFVTGRKKELIIVGGKNIYPTDLEAIANDVEGIYPGRAVAFGVFDDRIGTEAVIMVCELVNGIRDEDKITIERRLRRNIAQGSDVTLADVRLVSERWLIKTSSGKIARAENRERYLREFVR